MSKKPNKKPKWVVVNWLDSMGESGWHKYDPTKWDLEGMKHISVGHLIDWNEDFILISLSQNVETPAVKGDFFQIPTVAIRSVREIVEGKNIRGRRAG